MATIISSILFPKAEFAASYIHLADSSSRLQLTAELRVLIIKYLATCLTILTRYVSATTTTKFFLDRQGIKLGSLTYCTSFNTTPCSNSLYK